MQLLFSTDEKNLTDFFETISEEDIQECCDLKIYHRGIEYYNNSNVREVIYDSSIKVLKTEVEGNSNYIVKITLDQGEVSGSCSCPYGDVCKHIIATLLYAINDDSEFEIIPESKSNENLTKQYLQSLTKDALIRLVIKYAPEQFYVEVKNTFTDNSMALTIFKKVNCEIQKLFEDDDLLYSPGDFGTALTKKIKKLAELEKHLKPELEVLIFEIITKIDQAFDDGYLYDHYSDENYEPSDELIEFITNYVKSLDYDEKIVFIHKLQTIFDEQSYSTFECLNSLFEDVFTEEDLPFLKNMLMKEYQNLSNHLIEKYYDQVSQMLTIDENETILKIIQYNDTYKLIKLVNLYDAQNEFEKAINVIKVWLEKVNKSDGMVYSKYLELLSKTQQNIFDVAKEAITLCSESSMLEKIVSIDKDNTSDYELILEKENPGQLLEYLEKHSRLLEAVALIKRSKGIWENEVYNFFKRHKKGFPADAEKLFCEIIEKNLENAGDRYYQAIADALDQLVKINQLLAFEYVKDIRFNYKRRRNLMSILSKF